jgi:hypothetical protein
MRAPAGVEKLDRSSPTRTSPAGRHNTELNGTERQNGRTGMDTEKGQLCR